MELHEIQNVEQRVKSYWYADGWAEIAGGGVLVLLGLFFAGQEWFPEGSLARVLFGPALLIVLLAAGTATRWLVDRMKSRYTYPRTGYISYRVDQSHAQRRKWIAAVVGAVFAALLVAFAVTLDSNNWVPGFTGILMGGILIYMKARASGLQRFYWLAAFSAILGIALSFAPLVFGYRLAVLYGLFGLACMLSGALGLRRYLSENPLPPEAPREP